MIKEKKSVDIHCSALVEHEVKLYAKYEDILFIGKQDISECIIGSFATDKVINIVIDTEKIQELVNIKNNEGKDKNEPRP